MEIILEYILGVNIIKELGKRGEEKWKLVKSSMYKWGSTNVHRREKNPACSTFSAPEINEYTMGNIPHSARSANSSCGSSAASVGSSILSTGSRRPRPKSSLFSRSLYSSSQSLVSARSSLEDTPRSCSSIRSSIFSPRSDTSFGSNSVKSELDYSWGTKANRYVYGKKGINNYH